MSTGDGQERNEEARFPSLAQAALYKRIAAHMRELIETGRLQPGERLPAERDLARMLGVSRIPVREAMRTLAARGLVEIHHGQGTFVAATGMETAIHDLTGMLLHQRHTLEELFAVRRLLEPASAQWAAVHAGRDDVERLAAIQREMAVAAAGHPPDYEAVSRNDARLHREIAACASNRVLQRIMQAIQDLHEQQLETSPHYRGRLERTVRDHSRIVEAIAAGDPVEAGAAMLDHLNEGEAAALTGIVGLDDLAGPKEVD